MCEQGSKRSADRGFSREFGKRRGKGGLGSPVGEKSLETVSDLES